MKKIKKAFSNLRENTPKRLQWVLLALAFVVVLILMTLLFTNNKSDKVINIVESKPINLIATPETISWADVQVGEVKEQTITISATGKAKVMAYQYDKNIEGLVVTSNCEKVGDIDTASDSGCTITVIYAPVSAMTARASIISIDWRGTDEPEKMKKTEKYTMVLGAVEPKEENPEPIIIEKIVEKIVEVPAEPVIEEEEDEPDVDLIAPAKPFGSVTERGTNNYVTPSESCSDFAFPGYGTSGQQIGWIKPKGGAYYFYPFSDKQCENPTGVYNPDNGIITDIKNKSKKIGTDADHIGYAAITNGKLPELSNPVSRPQRTQSATSSNTTERKHTIQKVELKQKVEEVRYGTTFPNAVISTQPYDRRFVLRQYKPIPATIVSEVRADVDVLTKGRPLPVRATVDRNVYSDDGRTIIIPTGTMMLGYVTGEIPGPYKAVGRMEINWYQFIRPDGVEFNFTNSTSHPFAGDAQGRVGVPGRGSTDYLEQFFMPMLTAIVPAAVNLIAPVTDAFVNQIDLDNNTVVQSGTVRSSELAKNEIITAWNQVAQKLLVDMMDNTVPPFTIAAGTRITVYSPVDLVVSCADPKNKVCHFEQAKQAELKENSFDYNTALAEENLRPKEGDRTAPDWVGQVRSFAVNNCCKDGKPDTTAKDCDIYDHRTLVFYCQSSQYKAINNAKQDALYKSQQEQFKKQTGGTSPYSDNGTYQGTEEYNKQVLGLEYDENGAIKNPFEKKEDVASVVEAAEAVLTCEDGSLPDGNGCCAGEIYTDMGEQGFNCCPQSGGDCFPPIL